MPEAVLYDSIHQFIHEDNCAGRDGRVYASMDAWMRAACGRADLVFVNPQLSLACLSVLIHAFYLGCRDMDGLRGMLGILLDSEDLAEVVVDAYRAV